MKSIEKQRKELGTGYELLKGTQKYNMWQTLLKPRFSEEDGQLCAHTNVRRPDNKYYDGSETKAGLNFPLLLFFKALQEMCASISPIDRSLPKGEIVISKQKLRKQV